MSFPVVWYPQAFEKLRNALTMHCHVRMQAVGVIGETATAEVIEEITTTGTRSPNGTSARSGVATAATSSPKTG